MRDAQLECDEVLGRDLRCRRTRAAGELSGLLLSLLLACLLHRLADHLQGLQVLVNVFHMGIRRIDTEVRSLSELNALTEIGILLNGFATSTRVRIYANRQEEPARTISTHRRSRGELQNLAAVSIGKR